MIFLVDFKPHPLKKLQKEINQENVVARDKSRLASVNWWSVGFAFLLCWFSWFKVLCAYDKIRYAKKRSVTLPFWLIRLRRMPMASWQEKCETFIWCRLISFGAINR